MSAANDLAYIREKLGTCLRCHLAIAREKIVFGQGNPSAPYVIVGEGPGYHEDLAGLPFVGRSGTLLNKMIRVMGLSRQEVYITNVVKCRPPDNRDPLPEEISLCLPFLHAQIYAIRPQAILAVGRYAANTLAGTTTFAPISELVNQKLTYTHPKIKSAIPLQPLYHPAFILRKMTLGDMSYLEQNLRLMRQIRKEYPPMEIVNHDGK